MAAESCVILTTEQARACLGGTFDLFEIDTQESTGGDVGSTGRGRIPDKYGAQGSRRGSTTTTARFLNRSFPQLYAYASLGPRLLVAHQWLRRLEKAGVGQRLSSLPVQDHQTSNTIFVFGTGASINQYPAEWWDVIQRHDSIGMNFFLLHHHVPTFHVMETVNGIRRQLLYSRYVERGDYKGVPLLLKTQLSNLSPRRVADRVQKISTLHPQVQSNVYLSLDLLAAGRDIGDMETAYRLSERLGLWTPRERFLMLTKRRGSVSYIINFAVRAGYRNIVLCGIDLNQSEHFFESQRRELESAGLPVPQKPDEGPIHETNDPAKDPVTISHVITCLKQNILDPAGVSLTVASASSALYPEIPVFEWEKALNHGRN